MNQSYDELSGVKSCRISSGNESHRYVAQQ